MASQATVSIILKMIDKASGTMKKVGKSTDKMSASFVSAGKSMTRNVSLPLAAIGIAGVKMAADLDRSMRNVQAFGGQTEAEIKALSQTFKDMSLNAEFGTQSAQALADAFFNIQSAGFLGAEGMEVLEVSAKAATAGLTTTKKASEGIMTVLNAYSLTAKDAARVSDQLFTVVKLGVITFEQLIPTLGKVVPLANAMGIQFEELGAAYVVMTKQGLNAAEAATQQKAVMTQLLAPSEALQKRIQELGFASGQAMVDSLGFLRALDALGDSAGNDATEMQKLFVNTRAVQGAIALTGKNAEKAAIALQEMQQAGAAQEAFNTQMKSFSAQFSIFKNTLGVFLIDVGEKLLPVIMKLMEGVRGLFSAWQNLDSGVQTVIVGVGAFLAIGGPLLIFIGSILGAIGTIAGGFTALAGAFGLTAAASAPAAVGIGATAAATTALAIPLSAILIPLGLLAAAFIALTGTGPALMNFIGGVVKGFGDIARGAIQAISDVGNWVIGGFNKIVDAGKSILGYDVGKATGDAYGGGLAAGMVGGAVIGAQQTGQVLNQLGQQAGEFAGQMNNMLVRAVAPAQRALSGRQFGGGGGGQGASAPVNMQSIRKQMLQGTGSDSAMNSQYQKFLSMITSGGGKGGNKGGGGGGSLLSQVQNLMSSPDLQQQDISLLQQALGGAPTGQLQLGGAGARGGDVNITIEVLNMPPGTPKEEVDYIWKELGARLLKRGRS